MMLQKKQHYMTLSRLGGVGGGNWTSITFLIFAQTPWNLVTFSEIHLRTIWCGRLVLIDFDVTMATNFWLAGFQKMANPFLK